MMIDDWDWVSRHVSDILGHADEFTDKQKLTLFNTITTPKEPLNEWARVYVELTVPLLNEKNWSMFAAMFQFIEMTATNAAATVACCMKYQEFYPEEHGWKMGMERTPSQKLFWPTSDDCPTGDYE